jgi:hypothetical protein
MIRLAETCRSQARRPPSKGAAPNSFTVEPLSKSGAGVMWHLVRPAAARVLGRRRTARVRRLRW